MYFYSMLNLTPFLLFDGNCAEAMAFYQSCLNGELTITENRATGADKALFDDLQDMPFFQGGRPPNVDNLHHAAAPFARLLAGRRK
jgi:uncharacterized glyoxalase superfamily protein PhnB